MQRDSLAQRRGFGGLLEQSTALTRGQRLITATWTQPALFRRAAGVIRGRPRLPPLPQQLEDFRRQHHVPVLAALRLHDADDHLLAVDVTRPQPHHLAGPQPATIGQRKHRSRLQARRHGQDTLDLLRAQHRRQPLGLLDVPNLGRQIVATERDAEQEPHPGHDPIAVANARPALDQVQLKSAHHVGRCRIGRAFKPGSETLATVNVAALRVRGELARSHVLDHALTQRTDSGSVARGSSILSEVDKTSISGRGSQTRQRCPLSWLPVSRFLPPRSGLERSDFVHWHVWDMPTDAGNVCFLGYFGSPFSGSSDRRAGWSRRRNPPSCRFITADHDPPYALAGIEMTEKFLIK